MKKSGGRMNIKGPVNVPPIKPITMSNLGRNSPIITAKQTRDDLMRQRFIVKSLDADKISSIC